MKKRNKIVLFLLCLGLAFMLCACKGDSGSTPTPTPPPTAPTGVDVGDYARVWVAGGGCTLDLAAGTLTGSDDFEVKSITGEKANAVITCTADENEYTLSLNADGALDMKNSANEVVHTFMAAPSEFAGAWLSSDRFAGYYYAVSDTLNASGKFDWAPVNKYATDEHMDEGEAVTKFSFTDGGKATLTFVDLRYSTYLQDNYEHTKIYYSGDTLKVLDAYGDVYNLTPYGDCFDKSAAYLDAKEHKFSFSGEQIVFDGTNVDYQLKAGGSGSGLSFKAGNVDYFLQYRPDGLCLFTASEKISAIRYDPTLIVGAWSDEDNTHTAVVTSDAAVTYDGTAYTLSLHAKDGGYYYSFTVNSVVYTVNFIDGIEAAFEMKADGTNVGYYILDSVKAFFVGSYTDNFDTFTISDTYAITYEGEQGSQAGGFTYLPDFKCVAYYYGQNANKKYLVVLDKDYGAFRILDSDLDAESIYYSDEAVELLKELFTLGLTNNTDVFTTGGASPKTLTLDFENGTLTYDGNTYYFLYNYDPGVISGYPVIQFADTNGQSLSAVYSLSCNGYGLFMVKATNLSQTAPTVEYSRFISQAVYEELLGATFVYHGPLFDETVRLDTDGKLYIDSTDFTNADSAVTATEYNYGVERFVTGDQEQISLVFSVSSTFNVYLHIWNRQYATITDIYYARADFVGFIGSYHCGADVITLEHNGKPTVNGNAVTVTRFETDATENSLTVKYTYSGVEYTAVFTATGLTVTPTEGEGKAYVKFEFDTDKFVGVYTVGTDEIVVTSVASSVNTAPTLSVTLNGDPVLARLSLTEDGKQRLSFVTSLLRDAPAPPPLPPSVVYTLTLDGNTITVVHDEDDATKAAAEWSYADFAFTGNKTVLGKTFTCRLKENGTTPLFFYDGVICSTYTVSVDASGTKTLTLMRGVIKITLTLGVGNIVGVTGENTATPPPAPSLS